jgi:hypothetical protein
MAKVGRRATGCLFCTGYSQRVERAGEGLRSRMARPSGLVELGFEVGDALGDEIIGDLFLHGI